ncbi:MAG: site-2 protease family protein [Clostridia bacterium]|nr:site-2 protease family protein [Clostridia bacterium]MBR2735644.1 site-2 protease family protein [Clostridia bacterium]
MNILLIIIGLILFDLIVVIHEFGHFFWAKKFGVKVNEFALGMGPKILKFQKGETLFSWRLFPLGGFCAMEGEDEVSDNPRAFDTKPAWQRAIIIAFGAIMNLVLGFVMMLFLLAPNKQFASTTVSKFNDDARSSQTGLQVGDKIIKVDGVKIGTYKDLSFNLIADGKSNFNLEVIRQGEPVRLEGVQFETVKPENGRAATKIDFYVEPTENNFFSLIRQSFLDTVSTVKTVWASLIGMVTGRFSVREMSGPIGIVSVIGEATNEGLKRSVWAAIANIISLMAMLTINLGIFNLLPLPALDGGRLMFLIFEMITGKKVNPKYEGWIHALGFFLFIAFMLYISYSDILRLLGKT